MRTVTRPPTRTALRLAAALSCTLPLSAPGAQEPPYRAEDVAGIERFRGSEAARALLLQQGFVVADPLGILPGSREEPLRQVFSVYLDPGLPAFVTVDLVLDAWTALFEQVVLAVDRFQAPKLLAFSERLASVASRLDHPRAGHVARLAGAALALQRGDTEVGDHEVRRVLAALRGSRKILLGLPPIRAEDLEPTGSYQDDPGLQRYFRARRLYQLCAPDDTHDGRELAAAFARCLQDPGLKALGATFSAPFRDLIGPPVAGPLLPGSWTPFFELATRCEDQRLVRCAGTGLAMLAAGPLASAAGRRIAQASAGGLDLAARIGTVSAAGSHYGRFLEALALLQQPDPRAPALFRTDAWADLQASTQLAAWAQARHAIVLNGQLFQTMMLRSDTAPGQVAPCPRAFAALAREAAALRGFWERTALAEGDRRAAQAELRHGIECYDVMLAPRGRRITREEEDLGQRVFGLAFDLLAGELPEQEAAHGDHDRYVIERVRAACAAPPDRLPADARALLDGYLLGRIGVQLQSLATIAGRLAAIAEGQLAGMPVGAGDAGFLQELGPAVGRLHGYFGNSWLHPRDDHPRLCAVARLALYGLLQVGVARPERLYIVLAHEGRPVLHCGAVMSYRERLGDAMQDDAQWRKDVAERRAPPPPAFTASFRR